MLHLHAKTQTLEVSRSGNVRILRFWHRFRDRDELSLDQAHRIADAVTDVLGNLLRLRKSRGEH